MATKPPIDPNLITLARLPLAPLAVVFLVTDTMWGVVTAAVLALLLELTDLLDGKIARSYGVVTDFGKLFDPFSDAFSRYTLFLGLYAIGVADLWMIMAIFYRDSSVSLSAPWPARSTRTTPRATNWRRTDRHSLALMATPIPKVGS